MEVRALAGRWIAVESSVARSAGAPGHREVAGHERMARFLLSTRRGPTMEDITGPLVPGGRFHGFEIVEALASTSLSEILLARSARTGARVVLKLPSDRWHSDPAIAERFRREEALGQQLRHENLVRILPGPSPVTEPFVVMEYVPGWLLADELAEVGRVEARRAVNLVGQLCCALAYLHERRIVHAAVRPEHVWVTASGAVKLLDLGGVRIQEGGDRAPRAGSSSGGYAYCAPEQLRGRQPDAASDVYGAGAVLYELLTGVSPSACIDPSGLMRWRASSDPPTPRSWIPIDVALERIVVKAMAPARRERYGSARELAAELADPAAAMAASLEPSRSGG